MVRQRPLDEMDKKEPKLLEGIFWIGEWQVNPTTGRISREGSEVKLEPKVMSVLVFLAQRQGEVISREELEDKLWPNVIVSYDALSTTMIKLRKSLGDDSRNPKFIETISKKGYRCVAQVSTGSTEKQTTDVTSKSARNQVNERKFVLKPKARLGIFIFFVGLLAVFAYKYYSGNVTSLNNSQPSIVVLPFVNLNQDPEQEYFSDGITEDLITDLSQLSSLTVMSRTSAYSYKNKDINIKDVVDELAVRYVIEGSVRKVGDQVRITAKLIDSKTNQTLWAERFDRDYQQIFAVQDEVIQKIVSALAIKTTIAEKQRLKHSDTNNIAAYDMFQRGQSYFRQRSKESYELAIDVYRKAIEYDPEYARAYGAMAVILTVQSRRGWTPLSKQESLNRALELAQKAVALDRASAQAYWSLGFVHLFRKEYQDATASVEQAIKISPNYADAYGLLAFINNYRGNGKQAEKYIKKAIKLNPHHTFDYPYNLGFAYYNQARYDNAIPYLKQALVRNEQALLPRIVLAACYVRLEQLEDAQWEIEQLMIHYPDITRSVIVNDLAYEDDSRLEKLLDDLGKAGLPE